MNNNAYKTIKGSGLINFEILILLLINSFLIVQLKTEIINTIIIVLAFSAFDLFLIHSRFYFFSYNHSGLVVSHLWFSLKKNSNLSN